MVDISKEMSIRVKVDNKDAKKGFKETEKLISDMSKKIDESVPSLEKIANKFKGIATTISRAALPLTAVGAALFAVTKIFPHKQSLALRDASFFNGDPKTLQKWQTALSSFTKDKDSALKAFGTIEDFRYWVGRDQSKLQSLMRPLGELDLSLADVLEGSVEESLNKIGRQARKYASEKGGTNESGRLLRDLGFDLPLIRLLHSGDLSKRLDDSSTAAAKAEKQISVAERYEKATSAFAEKFTELTLKMAPLVDGFSWIVEKINKMLGWLNSFSFSSLFGGSGRNTTTNNYSMSNDFTINSVSPSESAQDIGERVVAMIWDSQHHQENYIVA